MLPKYMVIFSCKNELVFTHTLQKRVCEYMFNRLQELRWERNLSQSQLERMSGVKRQAIARIENNMLTNPTVFTAIRLAHALGVSVEDIFGLD
jgi:DNA-binding XRE family transcriptional regulator